MTLIVYDLDVRLTVDCKLTRWAIQTDEFAYSVTKGCRSSLPFWWSGRSFLGPHGWACDYCTSNVVVTHRIVVRWSYWINCWSGWKKRIVVCWSSVRWHVYWILLKYWFTLGLKDRITVVFAVIITVALMVRRMVWSVNKVLKHLTRKAVPCLFSC